MMVGNRIIVKIPIIQGTPAVCTHSPTSTESMSIIDFGLYAPTNPSITLIRTIIGNVRMYGSIMISAISAPNVQLTLTSSVLDTSAFTSGLVGGNSSQGYLVYSY